MRYNFTGEFLSDGRAVTRALIVLATNNEYNMDTIDAEIALHEYWAIRKQDAVLIDSIVDAAKKWLDKTHNTNFAKRCIYNRKSLDNKANRDRYNKICKALYIVFLQTTEAIVTQISKLSHTRPAETLSDEDINVIVDNHLCVF